MPTVTELRGAGRVDLYHGVQRFGGFNKCTRILGLTPARHPRGYWRAALAPELRAVAMYLTPDTPKRMPTTLEFRNIGRTDILNAVQAVGGVHVATTEAGLVQRKYAREVLGDSGKDEKAVKTPDENGNYVQSKPSKEVKDTEEGQCEDVGNDVNGVNQVDRTSEMNVANEMNQVDRTDRTNEVNNSVGEVKQLNITNVQVRYRKSTLMFEGDNKVN